LKVFHISHPILRPLSICSQCPARLMVTSGFANAGKKDIDEPISHLPVREPKIVVAKDVAHLSLVQDHPDECTRRHRRINLSKRTGSDRVVYVGTNLVVDFGSRRVEEDL